MSLHQQILGLVAEYRTSADADDYPVRFPLDALRAVVELHALRPCGPFPNDLCMHLDPHNVCATCGASGTYVIGDPDSTARCSTVQAIARELGIEATDA